MGLVGMELFRMNGAESSFIKTLEGVSSPERLVADEICRGYAELPVDNRAFLPPIFQSVSYSLPTVEAWEAFLCGARPAFGYSSDSNPTVAALEEMLARLQGTEAALVTSTGKGAIGVALFALLKADDHVVLLQEGYKSTRILVQETLARFNVRSTMLSVEQLDTLDELLARERTALVVIESPTNPITRVVDIRAISDCAHRHGALLALDNSLAGFHNHHGLGVDLYLHSLSKYVTGVGDVMGGAVLGCAELVKLIRRRSVFHIDTLDPVVARQMITGLHTYHLRIRAQCASALRIAEWLEQDGRVARVMYPGLRSHPDHEIAVHQMQDFTPVLAFEVKGDEAAMKRVLNALRRFRIAFGTGYTASIAGPTWLFYARSFPEPQRGVGAITKSSIRLSIGVEEPSLLIEDLDHALREV